MPAFNNSKKIHQPNRDLRVPDHWFTALPIATQCVYRIVRNHIDKFCRVTIKSGTIHYSAWDDTTHSYIAKWLTPAQSKTIFDDLYPEAVLALPIIIIVDECDPDMTDADLSAEFAIVQAAVGASDTSYLLHG